MTKKPENLLEKRMRTACSVQQKDVIIHQANPSKQQYRNVEWKEN